MCRLKYPILIQLEVFQVCMDCMGEVVVQLQEDNRNVCTVFKPLRHGGIFFIHTDTDDGVDDFIQCFVLVVHVQEHGSEDSKLIEYDGVLYFNLVE